MTAVVTLNLYSNNPFPPNFCTCVMSINPERSGFRCERANLRPYRAYFRPERADYKPGRVDLGPKSADFAPKCTDFMPKKVDFGTERVDLGLFGLISSLKEPDLGLRRDIWIDRWTDRQKGR